MAATDDLINFLPVAMALGTVTKLTRDMDYGMRRHSRYRVKHGK